MVVLNEMSRYHLAIAALGRVNRLEALAPALIATARAAIADATAYARTHFEDPPAITSWVWPQA